MTDAKLDDLISQFTPATEGALELDLDILNAIGPRQWIWLDRRDRTITYEQYGPGAAGNPVTSLERFTTRLDDAMTLVPSPYWLTIQTGTQVSAPSWEWPIVEIGSHLTGEPIWRGQLKTLSLTVCLAALKARNA